MKKINFRNVFIDNEFKDSKIVDIDFESKYVPVLKIPGGVELIFFFKKA